MEFDRENPSPLSRLPGAADAQWNDWTPEIETAYLQQLAGVERLEDASSLQLVVNTSTGGSIAHLGGVLPNLNELNLNGSVLDSLRDLGTGFRVLQVLWVSRCGLKALDGLNGLPALRELYAAYNDITDLQPVDACSQLEVLDVEGNCIADADSVLYLTSCEQLQTLSLAGNPAAEQPGYRRTVCASLPSLQCLDDQPVTPADRGEEQPEDPERPSDSGGGGDSGPTSPAAKVAPLQGLLAPSPLKAAAAAAAAAAGRAAPDALAQPHSDAAGISGVPIPRSNEPDPEEVALVVAGIKHARVGVDSHEFREIEMNLLVAAADGLTDVQLDVRPGTSTLLPSSTGTWVRTLRSSREGSLAALRAASVAAAAGRSGGSGSPASALSASASPANSRPPSSHQQQQQQPHPQHQHHAYHHSTSAPQTGGQQERWAMPSGALGLSNSLGASASGTWRSNSGGAGGGGLLGAPESPMGAHRPGSGGQRLGTGATGRPFSARPGTAASFSARIGTSASTGAAAPILATAGLYWAKNRISGGGAQGGGEGAGGAAGSAAAGGGSSSGADAGVAASSSKLTQGSDTTFGGSLARDLRKWKVAAVRSDAAASSSGVEGAGDGNSAAAAASGVGTLGGGAGLSLTLLRGGQLDPKALLEELKRWKLETADKVLFVDPDEAPPGGDASWSGADSLEREAPGGGADVLRLSNGHDPVSNVSSELSGLGLGLGLSLGLLEPALEPASPAVPGSPLQPARPPAGAAAAGRRKMVLAKVMRDIAADSVGGASISEILAGLRPVKTGPHGQGGPGSAWGPPGLGFGSPHGEQLQQHLEAASPSGHQHRSSQGTPGGHASPHQHQHQQGVQRAGSGRSGCSSDGLSVPSQSSRPCSRDDAQAGSGGAGAHGGGGAQQRPTSGSRVPGLPAGPSAPAGSYRVASVAGEVDVRSSNPQPVMRREVW